MNLLAVPLASTGGANPSADFSQDNIWIWIIKAVLIIVFLLLTTLAAIVVERKVVGRMQTRPGPNVNGPFGSLQSLADAMKLLLKEDVTVKNADKFIYIIAPMISVFAAFAIFAVIPFGPSITIFGTDFTTPLQLTDTPVAVLYILACASVGVYGIVLGGWASGSTYPLLGAVRSTAQVISYELAMGMSLVSVFMVAGSMSTSQIVDSQTNLWWALGLLPAFIIYVISMVGETNRAPFDLPEAEGELVGGFHTEYSSMKFAWFFLAEYVNMINVSAVATTLFLGGWRAPWPISAISIGGVDGYFNTGLWPVLWFVIKMWLCIFLFIWLRGTLPRLRYDQFMNFGWKILIPCALAWVVCVGVVQGLRQFVDVDLQKMLYVIAGILIVIVLVSLLIPDKERRAKIAAARDGVPLSARTPQGDGTAKPDTFDAFAGGFPVPPLPGQSLPPSPRSGRAPVASSAEAHADETTAGTPTATAVLDEVTKEDGDA